MTGTEVVSLEGLPNGAVVLDRHGFAWQRYGGEWLCVLEADHDVDEYGPYRVLTEIPT